MTAKEDTTMTQCEVCGNDYDKSFTVTMAGSEHTFDSFECAIAALAPVCAHCGCKVIGHGVEQEGMYFCCAHCATHEGVTGLKDRG
jgi:Rieske Fe-S protein